MLRRSVLLLALALMLGGCSGAIVGGESSGQSWSPGRWNDPNDPNNPNASPSDPNDPRDPNDPNDPNNPRDPNAPTACEDAPGTNVIVRRLSHVEFNRTLADLFPSFRISKQSLVSDVRVRGFENAATALNPSAVLIEQYADAAASVAELAGQNMGAFLPCASITPDMDCGRTMIRDFGRRAFRRPLTAEEQESFEAFFAEQLDAISFRGALELTLQAMLQAPQFLYRIELGVPEDGQTIIPLTDYEMATRLSYFLWQSTPDDVLLDAAEKGELRTAEQIAKQARRMVDDARATAAIVDFHRQWLSFDHLMNENKDPQLYPGWTTTLRDAMREESNRFVAHLYESGGNMLSELLTSRTTFVNPTLAEFYGVAGPDSDWAMAELPEGERSGILTRATFLAGYAHSTNGSPPLRGVAVMNQFLCQPPLPPPPGADLSPPMNMGSSMPRTNRELFEERTGSDQCQTCHRGINGLGFGFEAFDAMGAFRTHDNDQDVDATGEILGTRDINGDYDGALELSARLAGSEQVEDCMVSNYFRYAFAREPGTADRCALQDFGAVLRDNGGDVRELLVAIVSSPHFMFRPSSEEQ